MAQNRQLNRSLGLSMVIVVAISNIIGSGIYKKIAPMAGVLHSSGWVLLCWIFGGLISLFGALCNAEVAGLLADTGGEYVYYKKIYNRFFSFIFGWSLFAVIQTAAISSLAYIFAQSLNHIVHIPPLLESAAGFHLGSWFYPFADFNIKCTAIVLILLLTWINSRGIKLGARLSTVILLLVFLGIFCIIFFGLSSHEANLSRSVDFTTTGSTPVGISAVFTAMLAAFWAYQGWAVVGYIGGEVKDAKKNIPLGLGIGVTIVIVVYLLVNTTYLSLLPVSSLEKIYQAQNSIAAVEAVRVFWGNSGVVFISILIALTTLGSTHATILVSCRPYYAMAREGYFFSKIGKLNNAQVPSNSLWLQGAWACLLVLSGSFDQLTDMIIFAVFIYYGATTLGVFILRRKMPDAPRPYKVWGYPIVPAIVVLFSLFLFINTFFARPREASIGTILMLTGVPLYYWFRENERKLNKGKD
ncbi:MAG TPA: amino acid permease [Puia sp.]|nr:amino acid permease [Puia sp.]